MLAQANQQKQFDEINRAAILSRIQASRPVQQMGMVSSIDCLCIDGLLGFGFWRETFSQNSTFPVYLTFSDFYFFLGRL